MLRRRLLLVPALLSALGLVAGCAQTVVGKGRIEPVAAASMSSAATAAAAEVAARHRAADLLTRARNSMGVEFHGLNVHARVQADGVTLDVTSTVGRDPATGVDAGRATLGAHGLTLTVLQVDGYTWLQAPASFWQTALPAGSPAPTDTSWVPVHDVSAFPYPLASFSAVEGLVLPAGPDLTVSGSTTIGGHDAARVTDQQDNEYDMVTLDGMVVPAHVDHGSDHYDIAVLATAPAGFAAPTPDLVVDVPGL